MNSQKRLEESSRQIGNLLSGSWELTQKILENLSYREVSQVRLVCSIWADVGAKILEKRRRLHYLTLHSHSVPTTHDKVALGDTSPSSLMEGFFEHIVSKPRYCLAFCSIEWFESTNLITSDKGNMTLLQYLKESLPPSCETGLVCASGVVGTVENCYQSHWLESVSYINKEIMYFLNEGAKKQKGRNLKRLEQRASSGGENKSEGVETAQDGENNHSSDPLNKPMVETTAGTTNKPNVGYSIEIEQACTLAQQGYAVSLLLVPHHPGFSLKFFHLCGEKLKDFPSEDSRGSILPSEFNEVTGLSPNDSLKALMIFDAGLDDNITEAIVQAAMVRHNNKLALGGGRADYLVTSHNNNTSIHSFGVAVCGPNVMAASIVIPSSVTNPKTLEENMKELKTCGLPEKQSVAFMFTCCGRGYAWYHRHGRRGIDYHNVETKAFRRVFPNTPVFGFFGRGEIGMTYLPKFSEKENDEQDLPYKRRKRKIFHQFSTIVVLLSFL